MPFRAWVIWTFWIIVGLISIKIITKIIKMKNKNTNSLSSFSSPGILERAKNRISECCNKIFNGDKI